MILTSVMSVATPTPLPTPLDDLTYPVLSPHRGGLDVYPENTLTAFKAVRDKYPDAPIEFDVRALADGTPVIIHDATVDRTAAHGVTGSVRGMTKSQWGSLRIVDPAGGAVPASTLDEVVDEFIGTETLLVPELKDHDACDVFIEKLWPLRGQIVASSSNKYVVSRLVRSGFTTLQLVSAGQVDLVEGVYALGIRHTLLTREIIDDTHRAGVTVWAWTVNDQNRIDELMNMEVDAIISNDPRLTVGVSQE